MRKFAKISAVMAAMFIAVAFVGCKNDDDGNSLVTEWYAPINGGGTGFLYFYDDDTFKMEFNSGSVTMVMATGIYFGDTTENGRIRMVAKEVVNDDFELVDCPASESEGFAVINGTVLTLLDDDGNVIFLKK